MNNINIFSDESIIKQEIVNIQQEHYETTGISLTISLTNEIDEIIGYTEILLTLEELQMALEYLNSD